MSLPACGARENSIIETGAEPGNEKVNKTTSEATVAEGSMDNNTLSEEETLWLAVPVNTEEKEVLMV